MVQRININIFIIVVFLFSIVALQAQTVSTTGNWSDASTWVAGNIGDTSIEDVTFNNSKSATIQTGESYTINDIDFGNSNTLTIDSGGDLTLLGNLNGGNGTTLIIAGDLTINGDFVVNNDVNLIVTGNLIINGNLEIKNGGDLAIDGDVTIGGDFVGGNNTALDVDGSIDIAGDVDLGTGSTYTGTGTTAYGGTCTDSASGICNSGVLPVDLLYFKAKSSKSTVSLQWRTSTEKNNNYFTLSRSIGGREFEMIAQIDGAGTLDVERDYSFMDRPNASGTIYYKLSQTDFDGTTESFDVISVRHSFGKSIYVVWSKETRDLKVMNSFEEDVKLSIYNLSGNMYASDIILRSGLNYIERNPLPKGVYLFQYTDISGQQSSNKVLLN